LDFEEFYRIMINLEKNLLRDNYNQLLNENQNQDYKYHIKGVIKGILLIKHSSKTQNAVRLILVDEVGVKNDKIEYQIEITNNSDLLCSKLSQLNKNSIVYLTNMLPVIEDDNVIFYNVVGTKIYIEYNIYELEKLDWSYLEKNFDQINKAKIEKVFKTSKSKVISGADVTSQLKILTINDLNTIKINNQDKFIADFNQILCKRISHPIIGTVIYILSNRKDIIIIS